MAVVARRHRGLLNGRTVGLVALGRVGRWLLRYLEPFDVRVLVYDPGVSDDEAKRLGVEKVDLDTLMASCDAVSLHATVLDSTKDMIGAPLAQAASRTAVFLSPKPYGRNGSPSLIVSEFPALSSR